MTVAEQRHREVAAAQVQQEECFICKKTACLTADGWYEDFEVEADEAGHYISGTGEYFRDAYEGPHGFVCSNGCRSQVMWNHAPGNDREALRKVMEACRTITEWGGEADRIIKANMDDHAPWLPTSAAAFLESIAYDSEPEWCNV